MVSKIDRAWQPCRTELNQLSSSGAYSSGLRRSDSGMRSWTGATHRSWKSWSFQTSSSVGPVEASVPSAIDLSTMVAPRFPRPAESLLQMAISPVRPAAPAPRMVADGVPNTMRVLAPEALNLSKATANSLSWAIVSPSRASIRAEPTTSMPRASSCSSTKLSSSAAAAPPMVKTLAPSVSPVWTRRLNRLTVWNSVVGPAWNQATLAWASSSAELISPPTMTVLLVPVTHGSAEPAGPRKPPRFAKVSLSWCRTAQTRSASAASIGL